MKRIKKISKILLIIFISIIILSIITSSINNRIGNCTVKGKINGLGTRLALVSGGDYSNSERFLKLIMVVNGKFSFNIKLKKEGGGRIIARNMLFKRASGKSLWMRSKLVSFDLAPNQTISINGTLNKLSVRYAITGNIISKQKSEFVQRNLPILEKETQLMLKIDSLKFYDSNEKLINSLNCEFDKTRESYNIQRLKYVIQNPEKVLSASFLGTQDKDTIIKYLPTLGKEALATYDGKELLERVRIYKQTEAGQLAPNIVDANIFNLVDLKGKYVVLDFWGTWCGACVKGLPQMRTYYKKYRPKVEFIGIACNDKKSVWEEFIKNEGLQWTQLLNNPEINDYTKQYNIKVFPTKIIIDKEGKIVKIFEGESSEFYERLDLLMQE